MLSRIEWPKREDIPIPLNKLSLEHIMPQKAWSSEEWRKDIGKEYFEFIDFHSRYLNKIGNLTLLSGSMNSKLKNSSFDEKLKYYESVQFKITKKISSYTSWNVKEIDERGKKLIDKALSAISGPDTRQQPYTTNADRSEGEFTLADDFNPAQKKISFIFYNGETIDCKNWNSLFGIICEKMVEADKEKFMNIVRENKLAMKNRKKLQ